MPAAIPRACRKRGCSGTTTDRSGYCETHRNEGWQQHQRGLSRHQRGYPLKHSFNLTGFMAYERGGSTNLDRVQINVNGGSSNVWSSYLFGANGNAGGGTWNNPSDERLKYNIKTIENPIEKMRLFHGKTFTYKKGDVDSAGYIAQEVQKVLPEVVGEDNDGFLSLNVAGVGALHHEAILVLMDTVDNLTVQVAQLQAEINALKS